jgi:hypothetical protein
VRLPRRSRYGDIISRQLSLFATDERELLTEVEEARRAYARAGAGEAEERFGEYMDLVEEAEDRLLDLRDRFAGTMAPEARERYEREFRKAAERRMPSLVARREYRRAIDPELED